MSLTRTQQRLGVLAVLLLTFLVYSRSLANGYTYDDRDIVMAPNFKGHENFAVSNPNVPIWQIFTNHYTRRKFTQKIFTIFI